MGSAFFKGAAVGLALVVFAAALAVVGAYLGTADALTSWAADATQLVSRLSGIPHNFLKPIGFAAALAMTPFALRMAVKVAMGKVSGLAVGIAAAVSALAVGTATWLNAGRVLFVDGKPARFICPAVAPGMPLRVQFFAPDDMRGGDCMPVTPELAAAVWAERHQPEVTVTRVDLPADSLGLFALERVDQKGGSVLYVGEPPKAGMAPVLYRATAAGGRDPNSGLPLRPVSTKDLELIAESMRRDQEAKAAPQIAAAPHATASVKYNDGHGTSPKPTSHVSDTEWDTGEYSQTSKRYTAYFPCACKMKASVPLVVMHAEASSAEEMAMAGRVTTAEQAYTGSDVLADKTAFLKDLVHHLQNPAAQILTPASFPPGLKEVIFIRQAGELSSGERLIQVDRLTVGTATVRVDTSLRML